MIKENPKKIQEKTDKKDSNQKSKSDEIFVKGMLKRMEEKKYI